MKPPRMLVFWAVVIAVLLLIEVAEITHAFTVPFTLANPVAFVFALVFTTVVALVGAIFIGIYISQRLLSPRGFSPFEEEMLKMRAEVSEIRRQLAANDPPAAAPAPSAERPAEERP